jgi:uridine kinase
MQVTENILSLYKKTTNRSLVIGICGRAGAGKTTLMNKIKDDLKKEGIATVSYSGDWRFRLDSEGRKVMLAGAWKNGLEDYVRAMNQFSWWDFEKTYEDLKQLSIGKPVEIKNAYNRENGKKDLQVNMTGLDHGIIFFENAILGDLNLLGMFDKIVLVNTEDQTCFERLIKKDSKRRSIHEIASRYIITTYSENVFLKFLLDKFHHKTIICDSDGIIGGFPLIDDVKYIPVPLETKNQPKPAQARTIFYDIDGAEDHKMDETIKDMMKVKGEDGHLVLVSSRPFHVLQPILNVMDEKGLTADHVVCDLPMGKRELFLKSKD